jgi:Tat protein secretion system quality control protein TatD with DNase activity
MCQENSSNSERLRTASEDFPWVVGAYDAHCHPTDTMGAVDDIRRMQTKAITIMGTRSQDQDLVASVAAEQGLSVEDAQRLGEGSTQGRADRKVIPAFGWHPWFSYQLYDDTVSPGQRTYNAENAKGENAAAEKLRHLAAVLNPPPKDESFAAAMPPLKSLAEFIAETRERLQEHPTALVGEIGLDKTFRLPEPWKEGQRVESAEGLTPGGRDGRRLSPHHVKPAHQETVLKAQLQLAAEEGRAVSVHGVGAHGLLFNAMSSMWKGHELQSRRERKQVAKGAEDFSSSDEEDSNAFGTISTSSGCKKGKRKPYPPRICLHSFTGSVELLKQYCDPKIPARIFFSFSLVVNMLGPSGDDKRAVDAIAACPEDRILVESDLHIAGEDMDAHLAAMYRKVCEIKGWDLREGVERIGRNYREFIGSPDVS